MNSAHDDPAFLAMCREHEIEGTAMVALCGAFWDRALATHAGAAAAAPVAYVVRDTEGGSLRDFNDEYSADQFLMQNRGRMLKPEVLFCYSAPLAALTSAPAVPEAASAKPTLDRKINARGLLEELLDKTYQQGYDDALKGYDPRADAWRAALKGVQPGERGEG